MSRRSTTAGALIRSLLWADFGFFFSQLRDPSGQQLVVAAHHREWARLLARQPRLVLLAPRDHGKSTIAQAFILWLFYRHGRDASGEPVAGDPGTYTAVLFSATWDQAHDLQERFRDLLLANAHLIGGVRPDGAAIAAGKVVHWSGSSIRLPGGQRLLVRAFRTSTRGLHPDVLVLDDVLSDQNSGTMEQRRKTWSYVQGTLRPMHPARFLIVGTALHRQDFLHRLRDSPMRQT